MKKHKTIIVVIHLLFWTLDVYNDLNSSNRTISIFFAHFGFHIFLFYTNYFFIAKHLLKKPTIQSLLYWAIVYFIFYTIATWLGEQLLYFLSPNYTKPTFTAIAGWVFLSFFYYSSISTGTRILINWTKQKEETHQLELHKTNNEVQLLKNRINIPFFIDTLNTLETKAIKSPNSIQDEIIELSNILRYSLYESDSSTTLLSKEIEVLNQYLNLMCKVKGIDIKTRNKSTMDEYVVTGLLLNIVSTLIEHNILLTEVKIETQDKQTYLSLGLDKKEIPLSILNKPNIELSFSPKFLLRLSKKAHLD